MGPPFYKQVNGPLLLALLVLMGIAPLLAWRRTSRASLWRNFRWPLLLAALVGLTLLGLGIRQELALLAFAAAAFTSATVGFEFWRGTRARHHSTGEPVPMALANLVGRLAAAMAVASFIWGWSSWPLARSAPRSTSSSRVAR